MNTKTEIKRFRLYLKGLHVGITIRAERIEFDGVSVYFWNGMSDLVASFWTADITEVRESEGGIEYRRPVAA
jgi:hypothetical protein